MQQHKIDQHELPQYTVEIETFKNMFYESCFNVRNLLLQLGTAKNKMSQWF
jgi:hypothetical protein